MTTNELREAAQRLLRVHLDNAEVHPCDHNNDRVRAAHCMPEVRDLYKALTDSSATANEAAAQADGRWDGAEGWEPLAWALCAEEHGKEACEQLIWEGGPIPEPWGDRWLKYEPEAKRLIELVRKHAPALATQPVQAHGATVATVNQTGWELLDSEVCVFGVPVHNFAGAMDAAEKLADAINRAAAHAPAVDRGLSEAHEREAFEAWALRQTWISDVQRLSDPAHEGRYGDTTTNRAWIVWRARSALAASAPSQAEPIGNLGPLDPNEGDASRLWAEIVILREMLKGPPGFTSWQDAAVHERMAKNEALRKLKALAPSQAGSCQASGSDLRAVQRFLGDRAVYLSDETTRAMLALAAPPAGRTLTEDDDAKRYRWLRSNFSSIDFVKDGNSLRVQNGPGFELLDVVIDTLAASSTTAGERE